MIDTIARGWGRERTKAEWGGRWTDVRRKFGGQQLIDFTVTGAAAMLRLAEDASLGRVQLSTWGKRIPQPPPVSFLLFSDRRCISTAAIQTFRTSEHQCQYRRLYDRHLTFRSGLNRYNTRSSSSIALVVIITEMYAVVVTYSTTEPVKNAKTTTTLFILS